METASVRASKVVASTAGARIRTLPRVKLDADKGGKEEGRAPAKARLATSLPWLRLISMAVYRSVFRWRASDNRKGYALGQDGFDSGIFNSPAKVMVRRGRVLWRYDTRSP